jgi:hypothetical protein
MKVDGLHRALLYQPQHQIGYLLGFSALLLLMQARDRSKPVVLFLAGAFLGAALLFDPVPAAILALATAAYEAWFLVRLRRWAAFPACALAAAVPMGAALALTAALNYVDDVETGNPIVSLGVNSLAATHVGTTLLLDFGPVLLVAAAGALAVLLRAAFSRFAPLAILLGVCAAFYFFVDVPDHDSVYVAWRASHLAFMAAAALCAYALQEGWSMGAWGRLATIVLTAAVAAAALPTVLVDIYNAQDVENRAQGPGFRWTVVLSPGEVEALEWIRRSTPAAARVQVDPVARGRDTWAYLPAFAERRMSGGLPIGMIPVSKYEEASARIRQIYAAASADEAYERALGECVDYLVIGPPERAEHPQMQQALDEKPYLFTPAFRNDALVVYAVRGSHPPACSPARP